MSDSDRRHPVKTAGLVLLALLFLPLALFVGMWLAPVVLLFTPLYLMRGGEQMATTSRAAHPVRTY
jgi:hypothetical protein